MKDLFPGINGKNQQLSNFPCDHHHLFKYKREIVRYSDEDTSQKISLTIESNSSNRTLLTLHHSHQMSWWFFRANHFSLMSVAAQLKRMKLIIHQLSHHRTIPTPYLGRQHMDSHQFQFHSKPHSLCFGVESIGRLFNGASL